MDMHSDTIVEPLKDALAYPELGGKLISYLGLGFASALAAETIDMLEPAPYAAYYVGAVNAAISPRYWDLLAVIGLLLLCGLFPMMALRPRWPGLGAVVGVLLPATRQVLTFAFALGAVSAGILLALLLSGSFDSPALLAWGELLFGSHPVIALLLLLVFTVVLGCAGQILARPGHLLWQRLVALPGRYLWPAYGLFAALVLALLLGQQ